MKFKQKDSWKFEDRLKIYTGSFSHIRKFRLLASFDFVFVWALTQTPKYTLTITWSRCISVQNAS